MSQSFHHPGIYSFSNGFDLAQQSQRNKLLSLRGFEAAAAAAAPTSLVGLDDDQDQQTGAPAGELPLYETQGGGGGGGMLSEMFNFQSAAQPPSELLENHNHHHQIIQDSFRHQHHHHQQQQQQQWYGTAAARHAADDDHHHSPKHHHNHHQISSSHHHHHHLNVNVNVNGDDSASAMHLFLMKPQPRSPSPPLHILLPNQSTTTTTTTTTTSSPPLQVFHHTTDAAFDATPIIPQFTWVPDSSTTGSGAHDSATATRIVGGKIDGENQGLSLSLSPLHHLEAAKAEELRIGDGAAAAAVLYFNQGTTGTSTSLKNLELHHQQQQQLQPVHLQGSVVSHHHLHQGHQVHVGYSPSLGMMNVLRNSKYLKPAQELLEEFCSVGRGQFKNNKPSKDSSNPNNQTSTTAAGAAGRGGGVLSCSSSSKDLPPLSASDRIQYQRRKAALLSILDEVDRRYNHYCVQMQSVVNSFDSIMGYGAARPYTALAQKAMSRHFRCLKDAIAAQLKQTRELLGEKDGVGASGITKGETPRLKLLDQTLRQQRAFHQIGMMEQEAWRPQRGLPERSVNILRAWLFEHFLHPGVVPLKMLRSFSNGCFRYPSDADKHLLARQTGLSRNQVSNWFINARVRLWKPMVEEMYQQESKDEEDTVDHHYQGDDDDDDGDCDGDQVLDRSHTNKQSQGQSSSSAQTPSSAAAPPPPPPPTTTTTTTATATATTASNAVGKRSEIDAIENDPSSSAINAINAQRCFPENQTNIAAATASVTIMPTTTSSTSVIMNNRPPTAASLQFHHHHPHHQYSHHHHQLHQLQQHQQVMMATMADQESSNRRGIVINNVVDQYGPTTSATTMDSSTLLMFGSSGGAATTGDHVSLTLGLRHAPENNRFPLSDFGSC
ncbi:hypothetical protein Scep_020712 [Stephania cephalantha]|uniref:Homeobox domain-containing protein n=1 Tax=Stephania cephalantha TaxID=152367 RepID=A0AAP0IDN7_9MAGN